MRSPVQEHRFDRLFRAYDADRDGRITLADFTDHIPKLAAAYGYAPDSARGRALTASLRVWWDEAVKGDTDHDGALTRAEVGAFAETMAAGLRQAAAKGHWPLDQWVDALYGIIDADGDDRIQLDEYRAWCDALGLSDGMNVDDAFGVLDVNGDGYISRKEFSELTRQFWLDPDPSVAGHRLLGP